MLVDRDHLDLNWAGTMLQGMAAIGAVDEELQLALTLSLAGDQEINPAYREVPESIWEHPVTSLLPERTREVAELLARLGGTGFPLVRDIRAYLVSRPDWRWDGPSEYFPRQFRLLREFYATAAARGLCVALWWD